MNNENTFTCQFTTEEFEELCYAIDEREDALRMELADPSLNPEYRRPLREHFNLAHNLRIRLEQEMDGYTTSPAPSQSEKYPAAEKIDFTALVLRGLGCLTQTAGTNCCDEENK